MRDWILSDVHIEQSHWDLPDPQPDFDVLIAAGDIHDPLTAGVRWLAERSGGRPVIYVPGNHEWHAYRQRFTIQYEALRAQELADELGATYEQMPDTPPVTPEALGNPDLIVLVGQDHRTGWPTG